MFHPLPEAANTALPSSLNCPMCYTPHPLVVAAARRVDEYLASRPEWSEEISKGKMMGALVVETPDGEVGYVAAFSGNLGGTNYHEYFVPAVFDFQQAGGVYKTEERQIMDLGERIDQIEADPQLTKLQAALEALRDEAKQAIAQAKADIKANKRLREAQRTQGIDDEEKARLTAESQHEKAELKRLERRYAAQTEAIEQEITTMRDAAETLRLERAHRSRRLQRWLFGKFRVLNARGEMRSLGDIFATTPSHVPPSGAGECCAPKLLQYAYRNGLRPVAIGEWWHGASPKGEVRHSGAFYPACHSKCEPILGHMLTGLSVEANPLRRAADKELKIVYKDEWLVVVDKPSGLCSVPGHESDDSCLARLGEMMPDDKELQAVHRLDMDTSGLLVFARKADIMVSMQKLFASRAVSKRYEALLEGECHTMSGTISLPLRPDIEDRPRQCVDEQHGKPATTLYHVLSISNGRTRISFSPLTGRTHQLRVHAAHTQGLGCPIVGDNLYGRVSDRLCLHAAEISFVHPATGCEMHLESAVPF